MQTFKQMRAYLEARFGNARGNIIWYLVAGLAGVGIFYLIYFLFWTEIKRWFVQGH
ncbi:MAG TPA: hypothetical protein VL688_12470 [Verrucomicrobiae bacterium]|nr:hypothetical protein [Verrucomicrobiae bacterium]